MTMNYDQFCKEYELQSYDKDGTGLGSSFEFYNATTTAKLVISDFDFDKGVSAAFYRKNDYDTFEEAVKDRAEHYQGTRLNSFIEAITLSETTEVINQCVGNTEVMPVVQDIRGNFHDIEVLFDLYAQGIT